jgi:type IV pilus assembly protein PilQ
MFATVNARFHGIAAAVVFGALWLGHASGAAGPEDAPLPAVQSDGSATALLDVRTEASADGTVIRLDADGTIAGAKSFLLSEPARLVIDLPGIESKLAKNLVSVDSAHVQRIRVGQHEGKVRVVMDAGADASVLGERVLTPTADGLVVTFAGAEAPAQTAEAPSTATEAAPETSAPAGASDPSTTTSAAPAATATTVENVTFASDEAGDRLVVSTDRVVDHQIRRPSPTTLMIVVPGAKLGPEAATRVAPEGQGPVSLVSAFEQPGTMRPEVRVVVERTAGLEPRISKDGNDIVLIFERSDDVASALPIEEVISETVPASAAPASPAAGKAVAAAAAAVAPAEPSAAALEGTDPIDQLDEGGLLDGKEYVGRRISLDFKDVDIRDVLRLIADVSDLNIIAGDEVKGEVTIRLVDVPWDQALDVILLTKGLGFVRVGNVLRIAPSEMLKTEEEARLQERRAKEKLEDLVVKLQPVNYANVGEVSKLVKRLLTPRGTVDTDTRTSTVIIKDIPSVIDEATALIKAIDSQTPQVMIETRIVEASLDFSKEIGTEWGFGSQPDSDETDFTIGGMKPITQQDTRFPFDDANNVVVTNPITLNPAGLLNLGGFLLNDRVNVDVRIAAAELNGEGKVISSPRVVTLDNREAIIEQGVSIPFQTFENGDAQLEFIDAVLSLKVTPHITADRSIIMAIEVTRNAPDNSIETPTGSPAIAKNQAKTETLVQDGQTLVLGGIYVIEKAESSQRVPGFWKIPVLGNAFRNFDIEDKRRELLIFVTPSVVNQAGAIGG